MKKMGSILKTILKSRQIHINDFANYMGVTRQAAANYFSSTRFSETIMDKILSFLEITQEEFINYDSSNILNIASEAPQHYKSNTDQYNICLDQLKTTNKMLEKALDNEAKALSLLDHFIKKSN